MAIVKKVPMDDFKVEMTLTKDEAKTIYDILSRVGGCPTNSRRRFTDSLHGELHKVFGQWFTGDIDGSIRFEKEV